MKYNLRYLAALFYDALVLLALSFVFTAILVSFRHEVIKPQTGWFQLGLLAIWYLYYSLSIHLASQTIGLKSWRLQITSNTGTIKEYQLLIRFFCLPLALCLSLLTYLSPTRFLGRWSNTNVHYILKDDLI